MSLSNYVEPKHDHIKANMAKLKGSVGELVEPKVVLDCFNICPKELEKEYHI